MLKRKQINSWLILGLITLISYGQQDAQFSHYMYNPTNVNPAFTGYRDVLNVTAIHRSQWLNVDGSPTTQTLSVHSPLSNPELGLGFNVTNDKIGPSNEIYANIDFSYTLLLRDYKKLSFGIKGGAHILNVNYDDLNILNPSDNNLGENIKDKFFPQIGVGLLFQTPEFYLGAGVPDVLEIKHLSHAENTSEFLAKEKMNFYFNTGYFMEINDNLKMQPSAQVKVVQGTPLQVDLSSLFLINDKFTLGASYRVSAAFSGLAAFNVTDQLLLGVSYDYDVNGISDFSDGSYEFILRFELSKKHNSKILNPRFF